MSDTRPHLEPGPNHPITVEPYSGKVTAAVGDLVLATTSRALELREADYPPVWYVPLEDVAAEHLRTNEEHTYCPFKGEASYYDIVGAGETLPGAIWTYPEPYPAVEVIRGHVAFYPDRVKLTGDAQVEREP